MIFLWNVTNENLDFTYGGLNYAVAAGKRLKVEEPMGNHALNALGPRGLTKLVFDDDGKSVNEEQIEKDAIERNRDFKIRQVVHYNERNERRRAAKQAYDMPTPTVKRYAAEIGINLLLPYTLAEGERGQIGILTQQTEEQKKQIEKQEKEMQEMREMLSGIKTELSGGFVKVKEKIVSSDDNVVCEECGEKVLAKRLKTHMRNKHGG
jgi:DNA-directed RNA polymerase subunit RPC12/RpoP